MPRTIEVTARPTETFRAPDSDGYILYSSLLSKMQEADEDASQGVHDSDFSSISVSSLSGRFEDSNRKHQKKILSDEEYSFEIGVTDPDENGIFEALVKPLVLDGGRLDVGDGTLVVEEFRSNQREFDSIIDEAEKYDDPSIDFEFKTPTCIKYGGSEVTEMFPHRTAVFSSLVNKWNQVVPDDLQMDLTRDEIGENVIEKPRLRSLRTHSVVVNRVYDEERKHESPILRQGFTGDCRYEFRDASEDVHQSTVDEPVNQRFTDIEKAVTVLSLFAEYSGVGSAVSRGCGDIKTNIKQGD